MQAYIYKFFPYYEDNLKPRENDMLALALLNSLFGFILVVLSGIIFQDLVVRKYSASSPDFVKYYRWVFPFGFGLTFYSLLEAYAWQLKKSVVTNFLRDMLWRFFITVLSSLFLFRVIPSFDVYIKVFSFTYILLAIVLLILLLRTDGATRTGSQRRTASPGC